MMPPYSYIAFEGPLKSGTRELSRAVAHAFNAELIEDLTDNPFLDDFYKNKNGAAFQTQLFFLLNRFQILEGLKQPSLFHSLKISNFIIEKDRIYAYQNLSDSELSLYENLYPMLSGDRVRPDLVVYLQMSASKILESLKKRKDHRFSISPEYVEEVVEAYNRFFFHYDDTPLVILNANHVQVTQDPEAFEDLLAYLQKPLRGVNYYSPKTSV